MKMVIIGLIIWEHATSYDINSHTYLSDIYGHLAECKGGIELKEFTQQML